MPTLEDIDRILLAEHAGAADPERLATLYREAGVLREADGAIDAACFLYTHGYVFALEAGHTEQIDTLYQRHQLLTYFTVAILVFRRGAFRAGVRCTPSETQRRPEAKIARPSVGYPCPPGALHRSTDAPHRSSHRACPDEQG